MTFLELAQYRHSVRSFKSEEVEQEKLDYLIDAAQVAPSAVNLQPWSFIIAKSEEAKNDIRACYDREWFKSAPLYIVVCGNHEESWKRPTDGKDHCDIDIAIATEHIALAAEEIGLATCWVCNFDAILCKQLFALPAGEEPAVIIPIGYAADEPKEKKRKSMSEIVKA